VTVANPSAGGPVERVTAVLAARGSRRQGPSGWQCPAHDDRIASLSVHAGADGRALLWCHAGCPTPEVVAALGLRMAELFPAGARRLGDDTWTPRGAAVASYPYVDEGGRLLFVVCRTADKQFPAWRPDAAAPHASAGG
jgi:hypothetical protein